MYHEFGTTTSRSSWKYTYKGKDLYQFSCKLVVKFTNEENILRKNMSDFMLNPSISPNSEQVTKCKNEIERVAKLKEECEVYKHEFNREVNLEREFNLGLGDIVFFGLTD